MNTDKIKAFVYAAECGSFSAAAKKQGKAQSWISNAISDLEIDLNLSLFDRSGYKPILTNEGAVLLFHAKNMIASETTLLSHAHHLSSGIEDRVVLAIDDWLKTKKMRQLIVDFQLTFPTVELVVRQLMTQDIVYLIEKNEVDVGLATGRWFFDKSIRFQTIDYIETCLICSKGNPLTKTPVGHADLFGFKQVSRSSIYNLEHKYIDLPDIERVNVSDMESVITLVENDIGWAVIPKTVALENQDRIDIIESEVSEKGHLLRIELITPELKANGVATQWLKRHLINHY